MSLSNATQSQRPWYREIWPWLLMLPPAFSVAGGLTMIYLANNTPRSLVVQDYARIEEITSERFERDRHAAALGLTAELTFVGAPARVEVTLDGPTSFRAPRTLTLFLRHATDAAADRELQLLRSGNTYIAAADSLQGRYRIELMPQDRTWRLGETVAQLVGTVTLEAQHETAQAAAPTVSNITE